MAQSNCVRNLLWQNQEYARAGGNQVNLAKSTVVYMTKFAASALGIAAGYRVARRARAPIAIGATPKNQNKK